MHEISREMFNEGKLPFRCGSMLFCAFCFNLKRRRVKSTRCLFGSFRSNFFVTNKFRELQFKKANFRKQRKEREALCAWYVGEVSLSAGKISECRLAVSKLKSGQIHRCFDQKKFHPIPLTPNYVAKDCRLIQLSKV